MSVRVRPVPLEEKLKTWNFPLYPINRRVSVRPRITTDGIPVIEGRKLRVKGKDDEGETSCFFCTKPKSRPRSAVRNTVLLSSPQLLLYPRFNENRPSSRKECKPKRLTIDGRHTPLAMECWQTNIKNHQMNQTQQHTNSNTLITRTVLEDKSYLSRTNSLPILLEKKSVEMKPRYEPKKSIRKRIPSKKEERAEQPTKPSTTVKTTEQVENQKAVGPHKTLMDHNISVTITDKRTRSVVRASSASSLRPRALQRQESIEF